MFGAVEANAKLSTSHILEKFSDELYCPICKDFLSDPMLTKECLHRFCAQCIQREIARGLRHCPTCARELPKKVPFKSDPNFASILGKLISQQKKLAMRDAVETMRQNGTNISFYKRTTNNLKRDNSQLSTGFPEECDSLERFAKSADDGCGSDDVAAAKSPRLCDSAAAADAGGRAGASSSAAAKSVAKGKSTAQHEIGCSQMYTNAENSHKKPSTPPPSVLNAGDGENAADDSATATAAVPPPQLWGEKQRLNRDNAIPLILWPDGSIFRNKQLPAYLQQPKYIYVPPETTVAHLAKYLLIRTEVETSWKNVDAFRVEITAVEDERDEFELLMRAANKVDYLTFTDANVTGDYTLMLKNNNEAPNIMLTLAHPFRAAPDALAVADLLRMTRANLRADQRARSRQRPPKVVYRFVEAK